MKKQTKMMVVLISLEEKRYFKCCSRLAFRHPVFECALRTLITRQVSLKKLGSKVTLSRNNVNHRCNAAARYPPPRRNLATMRALQHGTRKDSARENLRAPMHRLLYCRV